jgi:protein-tyrosine-phosphatase
MTPSCQSLHRISEILRALRSLTPRERWAYLRLQVRDGLSRRRRFNPPLPRSARSVLFVCQGNIIRSPFAAALFPRLLPSAFQDRISTASAGLDTTPGKAADPRALQLAKEFDVSLDLHRTQRLTPALVESTDLIFVMDTLNMAKFTVRYPGARDKLFMLGAFAGPAKVSRPDIPDPYNGTLDDVRRCYQNMSQLLSVLSDIFVREAGTHVPLSARQV